MYPRRILPWLIVGQVFAPVWIGQGHAQAFPQPRAAVALEQPDERALEAPARLQKDRLTRLQELESGFERTSDELLRSLEPQAVRDLVVDAVARNPGIARARQRAAAAMARAPQVRALPDPVVSTSLFLLSPETRVGPQLLSAGLQQRFPWFGKLALRERAALLDAAEATANVATVRLDVLTEARRLYYELAFLERQEAIISGERNTLVRFESLAQARYAAGSGLQQEIVRIQVQITTIEIRLLELGEQRARLRAEINVLRDRPADAALPLLQLPELEDDSSWPPGPAIAGEALRQRPEVVALDARLAASEVAVELARKSRRPDVTLGLSYTLVGKRTDGPGRAAPPPDNGDDILALSGSVSLPVRTRKLEAELAEAVAHRLEAQEARRQLLASIAGETGDLVARLPLLSRHFELLASVLSVQAREALRSAETAYSTGKLNAVDLLDAEVVLFEVETAIARTRTDWNIARARLERALTAPLGARPAASSTDEEGGQP